MTTIVIGILGALVFWLTARLWYISQALGKALDLSAKRHQREPRTNQGATMSDPQFCRHYEHAHVFSHEGTHCDNCGKQLTILETLNPNERWTITNDGKGSLTIEHH